MKKMVFIACALMLVAAGSAMASGTNLSWNDCQGGGGAQNLTLTCTNAGSATAFTSFISTVDIPKMGSSAFLIDVQSATTVTTWWLTNPVGTRWGSGSTDPVSGACAGWWTPAPSGPIVFAPTAALINNTRIRLELDAVVSAGEEVAIVGDGVTEYFGGSLVLKKSAGTAGNVECTGGAAIGINNLEILQPGSPPPPGIEFTAPAVNNCMTIQGGGGKTCPAATPTKKATWGSIKALYR